MNKEIIMQANQFGKTAFAESIYEYRYKRLAEDLADREWNRCRSKHSGKDQEMIKVNFVCVR